MYITGTHTCVYLGICTHTYILILCGYIKWQISHFKTKENPLDHSLNLSVVSGSLQEIGGLLSSRPERTQERQVMATGP